MPCRIISDIRLFLAALPDIRSDNPALSEIRPNPIKYLSGAHGLVVVVVGDAFHRHLALLPARVLVRGHPIEQKKGSWKPYSQTVSVVNKFTLCVNHRILSYEITNFIGFEVQAVFKINFCPLLTILRPLVPVGVL